MKLEIDGGIIPSPGHARTDGRTQSKHNSSHTMGSGGIQIDETSKCRDTCYNNERFHGSLYPEQEAQLSQTDRATRYAHRRTRIIVLEGAKRHILSQGWDPKGREQGGGSQREGSQPLLTSYRVWGSAVSSSSDGVAERFSFILEAPDGLSLNLLGPCSGGHDSLGSLKSAHVCAR